METYLAGGKVSVLRCQVKGRGAQPVGGEGGAPGHEPPHPLRVPIPGRSQQLLAQLNQRRLGE